jgi:hypothetical protein
MADGHHTVFGAAMDVLHDWSSLQEHAARQLHTARRALRNTLADVRERITVNRAAHEGLAWRDDDTDAEEDYLNTQLPILLAQRGTLVASVNEATAAIRRFFATNFRHVSLLVARVRGIVRGWPGLLHVLPLGGVQMRVLGHTEQQARLWRPWGQGPL